MYILYYRHTYIHIYYRQHLPRPRHLAGRPGHAAGGGAIIMYIYIYIIAINNSY